MTVPARSRLPRADRARQLLGIAQRMIAEDGFLAVSMDAVARRAGVTKPVLYDHFGSKDGLLLAIVAQVRSELLEATSRAVEGLTDPYETLRAGLLAYFEYTGEHAEAWGIVNREAVKARGETADQVDALRQQQIDLTATMIRLHAPHVEPLEVEAVAHAINGACEWVTRWRETRPEVTAEQATDLVLEFCWDGLATRVNP